MRFNIRLTALILAVLFAMSGCSPKEPAGLALTGGLLIDGTGNPPIPDSLVLVSGGRIKYAGPPGGVSIPRGYRKIDIGGSAILPGLINTHVHNAYNEKTLQAWARVGVTTVRDLGGYSLTLPEMFEFRDRVSADNRNARIVAAGFFINVPGGYPAQPWGGRVIEVGNPEEGAVRTAETIALGADIIKIAMERGRLFSEKIPVMYPATVRAVVDTAHEKGRRVTCHTTSAEDIPAALEAGIDELAHMVTDPLTDEQISAAVGAGILWVPTLELWRLTNQSAVPVDNLRRFHEAGGRIVMGTDYDGTTRTFEIFPLTEMTLMARAGMSPMEIIVASTKTAAEACGWNDRLGTLEEGMIADILVVDGNPLDDIALLEKTRLVIHNGEPVYERGKK